LAFLSESTFQTIIGATPLVSIDLIVKNANGEVLLGYRTNRPAQGYWFVPGGRVQKNERLDKAFLRLTEAELGVAIQRSAASFMGVFEHLYDDSAFDEAVSTHYVVLGCELELDISLEELPKEQHNQYGWMTPEELLSRDDVHVHTKWYVE